MILYFLSEYAEIDFLERYDYLDQRSRNAALRWQRDMLEAFDHIRRYPATGQHRPEIAPAPYRIWTVDRFVIVYDPETSPITIVAILHGARDIQLELQRRAGNHAKEI